MGAIWRNEEEEKRGPSIEAATLLPRALYPKMDRIHAGKCQLRIQRFLHLSLK